MTDRPASPPVASGSGEELPLAASVGCRCTCWYPARSVGPCLQALSSLRKVLFTARKLEILRQVSQQLECPGQVPFRLSQNDFVASAKNLHFFALQSKLFRQAYGLTVSGAKYSRVSIDPPLANVYTHSIHI